MVKAFKKWQWKRENFINRCFYSSCFFRYQYSMTNTHRHLCVQSQYYKPNMWILFTFNKASKKVYLLQTVNMFPILFKWLYCWLWKSFVWFWLSQLLRGFLNTLNFSKFWQKRICRLVTLLIMNSTLEFFFNKF